MVVTAPGLGLQRSAEELAADRSPEPLVQRDNASVPQAARDVMTFVGRSRHLANRLAASAVLVLAVILVVSSVRYGLFQGSRPGPGLFPAIVAGGLVLLSVSWLIMGAGPERAGRADPSVEETLTTPAHLAVSAIAADAVSEEEHIDRAGVKRILIVVLWTSIPLLLLERLGYVGTMTVYVGGLLIMVARVRVWLAVLGAAIGAALSAYGADALGIALPDPLNLLSTVGL
jgi:hypothetical protein